MGFQTAQPSLKFDEVKTTSLQFRLSDDLISAVSLNVVAVKCGACASAQLGRGASRPSSVLKIDR